LRLAPDDAGDVAHAIRLNPAAWRPRIHTVRAMLPTPYRPTEDADVFRIAFSPDGATVAGACQRAKSVLLWHAASGELKGEPLIHPHDVLSIAFCPNGKVLTGCWDGGIRFWDAATGRIVTEQMLDYPVHALAQSSNGHTLLTLDKPYVARLYEVSRRGSLR
jgi:WD40 repeat protein